MYDYVAKLDASKRDPTGVVDGDTMNVVVDLGMDIYIKTTLRVLGINAPEMSTAAGKTAKQWAINWFSTNCAAGTFHIATTKDRTEKYGRYLAIITAPGGEIFNNDIVNAGMAVVYNP